MLKKVRIFMEMIKFEHTIFALPFAFMGAVLGARVVQHRFPTLPEWGWILMAMLGARSAAMALNRLIDAAIDAKNPRTMNRAIPTGLLKPGESFYLRSCHFPSCFGQQLISSPYRCIYFRLLFLCLYVIRLQNGLHGSVMLH